MKLAVIPGDGIGPEVVAQALRVLAKVDPDLTTTEYDFGARRYHATGELLTDADVASLREHDAILLIEGEDADRPGMVDEVPGHDPALTEVDVLGDDVPHVAREGPHARPHGQ